MNFKYTNAPNIVTDGRGSFYPENHPEVIKYLEAGNSIAPADPIPVAVQNAQISAEIIAEESKTLRAIREHLLGDPQALNRLRTADAAIAVLRGKLK